MRSASTILAASLSCFFSATLVSAQTAASADSGPVPGVRIVRLSQVDGKVQLDRLIGKGYETAFSNLPITQGARLQTGNGVAEVEFEDNSSMRLIPNTEVEFSELARNTSGGTISTMKVLRGTVYVSLAKSPQDLVRLTSSDGDLALAPTSHIEFHVGAPASSVSVFNGAVQAKIGQTTTLVSQKKQLVLNASSPATPTALPRQQKNMFDTWDETSVAYHKQFMNASSFSGNGISSATPRYGLSDLNYYGNFSDAGGCGMMWRPYFASAAWDPYGNGIWAFYQGVGYSWVSPYPWGWTPFHSGTWDYCPSQGWGWRPDNTFVGLQNAVLHVHPKQGPPRIGPRLPPVEARASLIAVNTQPLTLSKVSDNNFVFVNDSAGLGVPRQLFGSLGKLSSTTAAHGFATTALYSSGSGPQPTNVIANALTPAAPSSLRAEQKGVQPTSMSFTSATSTFSETSHGWSSLSAAGTSPPSASHH